MNINLALQNNPGGSFFAQDLHHYFQSGNRSENNRALTYRTCNLCTTVTNDDISS